VAEAILSVSGLDAYYGKSHILQGVGLEVREGELVVVVGRNGMGKTTLLKSILSFPPVRRTGSILFKGQETIPRPTHQIASLGIGYVPQGRLLFPSLSVEEHLRFAGSKRTRPGSTWRVEAVFDLFPELARRAKVGGGRLSGGEQQMLAIGRALVSNPSLLMMDEPSEGLSAQVIQRVEEVCRYLISTGMSILLVEQNLEMALNLAHRAYVFLNGEIALEESGEDFRSNRERVGAFLGV